MVTNEVWATANKQRYGMLCIGCLESRLGRKLNGEDFPDYPINRGFFPMSARMVDRIGIELLTKAARIGEMSQLTASTGTHMHIG